MPRAAIGDLRTALRGAFATGGARSSRLRRAAQYLAGNAPASVQISAESERADVLPAAHFPSDARKSAAPTHLEPKRGVASSSADQRAQPIDWRTDGGPAAESGEDRGSSWLNSLQSATAASDAATDLDFDTPVMNAGLVLLHPFFPALFERTGVVRQGELVSTQLERAAALLHYVATGSSEVFEFELGLIKVLLGLAPGSALPVADGELRIVDREEADGLLQSVIEHWSVLGETTPDGLRSSFLQRVGLLGRMDYGWRLRVEGASFDLLLAQLPWAFSFIKLPWLSEPVHVEWQTH
jgi:hypothetical protein